MRDIQASRDSRLRDSLPLTRCPAAHARSAPLTAPLGGSAPATPRAKSLPPPRTAPLTACRSGSRLLAPALVCHDIYAPTGGERLGALGVAGGLRTVSFEGSADGGGRRGKECRPTAVEPRQRALCDASRADISA